MSLAPATTRTKTTPAALASRWGIARATVMAWIRSGELRAINAAPRLGGKPRYLIDETDIAAFENRRSAAATHTPTPRRKRKPANVIQFF